MGMMNHLSQITGAGPCPEQPKRVGLGSWSYPWAHMEPGHVFWLPDPSRRARSALTAAAAGWTRRTGARFATGAGFGDVQPRYVFCVPLAGRSLDEVFAGFNQLWRRNIKKASKLGVAVREGDEADLATFHEIYVETAQRDRFQQQTAGWSDKLTLLRGTNLAALD